MAADQSTVTFRSLEEIGFPDYRVGDDGSVWSCKRATGYTLVWKQLKPSLGKNGYFVVSLSGNKARQYVHFLVLTAFCGPRPNRSQCRHLDGTRTNNNRENLAWGTPGENREDQRRHGRMRTKLTEEAVRSIASLLLEGCGTAHLAEVFEISQPTISAIKTGRLWNHLFSAEYLEQMRNKKVGKHAIRYRSLARVCLAV